MTISLLIKKNWVLSALKYYKLKSNGKLELSRLIWLHYDHGWAGPILNLLIKNHNLIFSNFQITVTCEAHGGPSINVQPS